MTSNLFEPQDDEGPGDKELLQAHVAGDKRAFATLFRRHYNRMWAVALRTCFNPEEAAEAIQEAMLSAHQAASSFRGDAAVSTWLHRIVVNACLDRARRQRSRPPAVPLPEEEELEKTSLRQRPDNDTALSLAVRDALNALPYEHRVVLVAVDVEGYSVEEAARLLDIPQGTVKSRCARGRAKLAKQLGFLRKEGNQSGSANV
ncbi:RNA polymerase, sigma-24 subunit, ECF subfamily [Segniliparus rotundus DSM 44985]|uniref:RNA polymerase, sigma-24 subunit, ECF subfamily n=1 Tax=Segniliparus rotundus (strain ATCC BAA-972 / CDC 1076 / CIP 108378 / DSM 44985 / JCM 13578) TaxID=640132 RepID=D6Z9H8_SEGRD|nr:RNA polymerase sigma factor SigM [Segniliparus rotundus]ADG96505.1 RNA polymerase, sigma-24 subunit, ECF subfamily [Segniliparus rotundus DSM 44985]